MSDEAMSGMAEDLGSPYLTKGHSWWYSSEDMLVWGFDNDVESHKVMRKAKRHDKAMEFSPEISYEGTVRGGTSACHATCKAHSWLWSHPSDHRTSFSWWTSLILTGKIT